MSEPTSPLMQQYHAIKTRYPHALLLFRLGDFYELFYEDAILASRELQITLTSRNREKGQPIPMCGVLRITPRTATSRGSSAAVSKSPFATRWSFLALGKNWCGARSFASSRLGRLPMSPFSTHAKNNYLAAVAKQSLRFAGWPLRSWTFRLASFTIHGIFRAIMADAEDLRDELQLLHPRETLLPRPQAKLFETAKTSLLEGAGGVESRLEGLDFPARLCGADFAGTVWRCGTHGIRS